MPNCRRNRAPGVIERSERLDPMALEQSTGAY
jgi:hypothetical protein